MRRKLLFVPLVFLLALFVAVVFNSGGLAAQDDNAPIRLQVATFNPGLGERPDLPPGLTIAGYAAGTRGYYIVQFGGPVEEAWKNAVVDQGAELLGYIPDNAYKVRMNPAQAARVANLGSVNWVGIFQPAFKISPNISTDARSILRVRVERGADAGQATAAIARTGAQVLDRSENLLLVGTEPDQVAAIANVLDVAWIENYVLPEKHNDSGAGVIVGGNTANAAGYDGSTQIAAVADTGLGDGTAAGAHPDIPAARIVSINNWPGQTNTCIQSISDDGAIDVDSAHGTHVSGSVLSDGGINGIGKGTAPAAGLVFQATENWATISNYCQLFGGWPAEGYFLTGLPDDLNQLYQQAYNDGARIHANSWGAALAGDYTLDSANTDSFIWTNRDMTITFSAGNDGADANNNGVVDNDSIGSPATAKNVITVGASENERADNFPCDTGLSYTSYDAYQSGQTCGSMGGRNRLGTAGQRWGFTTEPLNSDLTAGNAEQMAPFSSRGPTDDGRIKPDIVAPGTWILSTASQLYLEGYGTQTNPQNGAFQYDGWGMPYNQVYKYMGGTSMSNPIAAGAATVVRDYYQKAHAHSASAALVKATLINSAVDLLDENNDGLDDNDYPIPNVHEGWGRIDVAKATDGGLLYVDNSTGLATGGSAIYNYNVSTSGSAFKVSLVWSDYPSTESAAQNLVNNLNLTVTAPSGATYRGNVFSGGWSQTGGSADTVNNVENVYVQSAAAGTWTVTVTAANVPNGPQPFAIVVDGIFGPVEPTATPTITPTATNTPVPTITPTATNTPEPASTMHVGDLDGTSPSSGPNWYASVTITVHDDNELPVANASVSGAWTGDTSDTGSCTTGATGTCTINSPTMRKNNTTSVVFTVTGVTHGILTYDSAANHDPDADSSGTAIQVNKDGTTGNPGAPTPTPEPSPTAEPGTTVIMHVADLDGSSAAGSRNRWDATVTVTVYDAGGTAVSGATVSGDWSVGGSSSCNTGTGGTCAVSKTNIKSSDLSTTFSVTGITRNTGDTYDPTANSDPDGDSDGTTITVSQP